MIGTATFIIIVKSKPSIVALAVAALNFAATKNTRRFEIMRELGTLACCIENAKILQQDCTVMQRQYEVLSRLLEVTL